MQNSATDKETLKGVKFGGSMKLNKESASVIKVDQSANSLNNDSAKNEK